MPLIGLLALINQLRQISHLRVWIVLNVKARWNLSNELSMISQSVIVPEISGLSMDTELSIDGHGHPCYRLILLAASFLQNRARKQPLLRGEYGVTFVTGFWSEIGTLFVTFLLLHKFWPPSLCNGAIASFKIPKENCLHCFPILYFTQLS